MASIEKRGQNTWRLTVELGTGPDGKRIRRRKTIKVEDKALLKTTKKLREYLEQEWLKFKMEVEGGEYVKPEKMTFSAFVEEWRNKYAHKHLAYSTLYTYEKNLKNRILPALGHLRLDEIKPLHILNYLQSLEREGSRKDGKAGCLSSGTIQINHRIIKNILSRAVEWKLIKSNPAAGVKKPKVEYKVNLPYDEQEVQQLFQALQNEPFHWRMMVTLALTTGLRRGELLGLEWKHVDWKEGIISVEQILVYAVKGKVIIKEPKTKNSKRKVALPPSVLEELKEYYAYRIKERAALQGAWKGCKDENGKEYHLIFSHPDGTPFHQERPYQWFRDLIKRNGLRYIRFHDLRHTSATLLINQGVHAKIISERLGHSNITTTMNIYGHALKSADKAAAEKFENILPLKKAPL